MSIYSQVNKPVLRRPVEPGQYTSFDYSQTLDDHSVLASIGSVGDAYDNALAESFVDTFKTELIHDRVWRTLSQLELAIVEYVGLVQHPAPPQRPRRHPAGRIPGGRVTTLGSRNTRWIEKREPTKTVPVKPGAGSRGAGHSIRSRATKEPRTPWCRINAQADHELRQKAEVARTTSHLAPCRRAREIQAEPERSPTSQGARKLFACAQIDQGDSSPSDRCGDAVVHVPETSLRCHLPPVHEIAGADARSIRVPFRIVTMSSP